MTEIKERLRRKDDDLKSSGHSFAFYASETKEQNNDSYVIL